MDYIVKDFETNQVNTYCVFYQELRQDYLRYVMMSDEEFIAALPKVMHFACITLWIKEKEHNSLRDDGVIHELVHLLDGTQNPEHIDHIRTLFNKECCLAA